jgi:hypothetical protein
MKSNNVIVNMKIKPYVEGQQLRLSCYITHKAG